MDDRVRFRRAPRRRFRVRLPAIGALVLGMCGVSWAQHQTPQTPGEGAAGEVLVEVGEGGAFEGFLEEERRVFVLAGGVRVRLQAAQSAAGDALRAPPPLEVRAERMVLWVDDAWWSGDKGADKDHRTPDASPNPGATPNPKPPPSQRPSSLPVQLYAEGGVFLDWGAGVARQRLEAARLYLDLEREQGVFDEGRIEVAAPTGEILLLRARTIRVLGRFEYQAEEASLSTCRFERPHYRFAADRIRFEFSRKGKIVEFSATTLRLGDTPVLIAPPFGKNLDYPLIIRRLRPSNGSAFGPSVETRWDLAAALDLVREEPDLYDEDRRRIETPGTRDTVDLDLDYRGARGPGGGVSGRFRRLEYTTMFRLYGIADRQFDRHDADLAKRYPPAPSESRGRMLLYHQHRLGEDFEFDLRYSKMSDRSFLDEYFEKEARHDPPQETFITARWRPGLGRLSATVLVRDNEFHSEIERFPRLEYDLESLPVAWERLLYSQHTSFEQRRLRPDEALLDRRNARAAYRPAMRRQARLDAESRLDVPLPGLGPLAVTPFGAARYTAWSSEAAAGNPIGRFLGSGGALMRFDLWRVFDGADTDSRWWHTITPTARYEDRFASTARPGDILALDAVDRLDRETVVALGLEQRLIVWERRDEEDDAPWNSREVAYWRVDALGYPHHGRDHGGRKFGPIESEARVMPTPAWRLSSFALLDSTRRRLRQWSSDARYLVSEALSLSLAERIAWEDSRQNTATRAGLEARFGGKWHAKLGGGWDFHTREAGDVEVLLSRDFHDAWLTVGMRIDTQADETEFFFSFSPGALLQTGFASSSLAE